MPSVVRLRAFALGIAVITAGSYWTIMTAKAYRGPYPTIVSLFANVVFILALLAIANTAVSRLSRRKFLWAVMIAAAAGSVAAFWPHLHIGYQPGLSAKFDQVVGFANEAFTTLDHWWKRPIQQAGPNWGANAATISGFGFCVLPGSLRLKFFGRPFHPIGCAISGSWSMNLVWAPIMIAWTLKAATLRYGGLRLYKTALPFFLGLILGQMCAGSIWSIIGVVFRIPCYSFRGA